MFQDLILSHLMLECEACEVVDARCFPMPLVMLVICRLQILQCNFCIATQSVSHQISITAFLIFEVGIYTCLCLISLLQNDTLSPSLKIIFKLLRPWVHQVGRNGLAVIDQSARLSCDHFSQVKLPQQIRLRLCNCAKEEQACKTSHLFFS